MNVAAMTPARCSMQSSFGSGGGDVNVLCRGFSEPKGPPWPLAELCLERTLKFSLSCFKCSQFSADLGNLLSDSAQFCLGLLSHQVV